LTVSSMLRVPDAASESFCYTRLKLQTLSEGPEDSFGET
jgi:hypothetical protein